MTSHHFYLHLASKWPFSGPGQGSVSIAAIGCLRIPFHAWTDLYQARFHMHISLSLPLASAGFFSGLHFDPEDRGNMFF
jgi:hypothetical protein